MHCVSGGTDRYLLDRHPLAPSGPADTGLPAASPQDERALQGPLRSSPGLLPSRLLKKGRETRESGTGRAGHPAHLQRSLPGTPADHVQGKFFHCGSQDQPPWRFTSRPRDVNDAAHPSTKMRGSRGELEGMLHQPFRSPQRALLSLASQVEGAGQFARMTTLNCSRA
jgi:hypothetical protein